MPCPLALTEPVINLLGRLLRIRRREGLGDPDCRPSWRQCGRPTGSRPLRRPGRPGADIRHPRGAAAAGIIGQGRRELPGRPVQDSSPWLNLRVDGYSGTAALTVPFPAPVVYAYSGT